MSIECSQLNSIEAPLIRTLNVNNDKPLELITAASPSHININNNNIKSSIDDSLSLTDQKLDFSKAHRSACKLYINLFFINLFLKFIKIYFFIFLFLFYFLIKILFIFNLLFSNYLFFNILLSIKSNSCC